MSQRLEILIPTVGPVDIVPVEDVFKIEPRFYDAFMADEIRRKARRVLARCSLLIDGTTVNGMHRAWVIETKPHLKSGFKHALARDWTSSNGWYHKTSVLSCITPAGAIAFLTDPFIGDGIDEVVGQHIDRVRDHLFAQLEAGRPVPPSKE